MKRSKRSHREHFRRDGQAKQRFASKAEAEEHGDPRNQRAYQRGWPGCAGWHLARR